MEPTGVLYVRQKQWAVTFPGDRLDNGDKAVVDLNPPINAFECKRDQKCVKKKIWYHVIR
jgi:hypothetical protein